MIYPADAPPSNSFLRGDADGNGFVVGIVDALFLLSWQFQGGPAPPCLDAADADGDNSAIGLFDGLYLLNYLYMDGAAPRDPGPSSCGIDPDLDPETPCEETSQSCQP